MSEEEFNLTIGLLIAILGILITVYAFRNEPEKDDNESLKSASIQLKIFGIGCFICELIWAFR